jgi:tartrate dehydratase beta subunit/fumarate hydratase class I family protein
MLNIRNPQTNTYPVNVVITDDQTGDVIYTSGAIEPGEEVSHVQLEKTLAKGTHSATAVFRAPLITTN